MATKIGDLKINVGIDPRRAEAGLARIRNRLAGFSRFARRAGVVAAAGTAAAATAFGLMASAGLRAVDAQAKLARSVDGTIDGIRALQMAGTEAGVDLAQIGVSMQMMGARIAEAARDGFGPAQEALEMLGLSAGQLMNLDVDQRLALIADRVRAMGLNAQQASDLLRQFGIRNREMALLILEGGDAIRAAREDVSRFGLAIDQDAARGVERAQDALSRIGFVFEGLRNRIAVEVAPVLERLAIRFQDLSAQGGPLQEMVVRVSGAFSGLLDMLSSEEFVRAATVFGVGLTNAIENLASVLVVVTQNADMAGASMIALGASMAFFSGPIGLAIAAVAGGIYLLSRRAGEASVAIYDAEKGTKALNAALDVFNQDRSSRAATSAIEIANANYALAASSLDAAKAELAKARALAATRQRPKWLPESAGVVIKEEAEALAQLEEAERALASAIADRTRAAKAVISAVPEMPPRAERPADPAIEALEEDLRAIPKAAALAADGMKILERQTDMTAATARQFQSRFTDAAFSRGGIGNFFRRLAVDIAKARFQLMLFGKTGSGGLIGGVVTKLLGGLTLPGFANGTNFAPGGLAIVGERGREVVNLPRGSQVIPNHKLTQAVAGGGGTVVQFALNVATEPGLRADLREQDGNPQLLITRMVADDIASGGPVHNTIRRTFNIKPGLIGR